MVEEVEEEGTAVEGEQEELVVMLILHDLFQPQHTPDPVSAILIDLWFPQSPSGTLTPSWSAHSLCATITTIAPSWPHPPLVLDWRLPVAPA